jgi:EAL domain-containing protein (putative c-di-GMP-specific phosphodiesterase class I)/ActR/RegA family two-component response regulator
VCEGRRESYLFANGYHSTYFVAQNLPSGNPIMPSLPIAAAQDKIGTRLAYVLDDETAVASLVCQILTANGFVPYQFSTPMPFLAEVKAAPPELVVLDLALGDSDAIDVIRHLEVLKYKGKALLMSGRDESVLAEIEQFGQRHGLAMLPSLKKPFRANDLKTKLAADAHVNDTVPAAKSKKLVRVDLAEALRKQWLELWYQPKIHLKSLSVCGAEGLLRVRHPEHGIVLPPQFLPKAGDLLYEPLSKFMVATAMSHWNTLDAQNISHRLAVNVPTSVIVAPQFIGVLRKLLPTNPKFPGLTIEVTEDEIFQDPVRISEIATQLKLYNVSLSIDDFGSAYSSLSRLHELPFTELKLDPSFISNCTADKGKQSLCSAAIDLAHGFGATACAQGVENADDLRTLIEMRCDTAQGILFAKPMPFEQFVQHLRGSEGPAVQS